MRPVRDLFRIGFRAALLEADEEGRARVRVDAEQTVRYTSRDELRARSGYVDALCQLVDAGHLLTQLDREDPEDRDPGGPALGRRKGRRP